MAKFSPVEAMLRAIALAKEGAGFVAPNPLVGCVILDSNGNFLAEGFHKILGGPHAEVEAISKVSKDQLKGAHLFVTLEPCAHQGRTPPCADLLSSLPLASVTYGVLDPNPLVAGKGLEKIKKAGIEVRQLPELNRQIEELAEIFLWNMRKQKPFVALKVATSLDGQMALSNGQSQWITSEVAREHAQYLRGCYDAILIGRGTFEKDNPRLNSRHQKFSTKTNKVIVLDPEARALNRVVKSKLLEVRPSENILWVIRDDLQVKDAPVPVLKMSMQGGFFDINKMLQEIYKKGITSIYVEGGAYVFSKFLENDAANRLYQYIAPKMIGAGGGLSWTSNFKIENLNQAKTLHAVSCESIGSDFFLTGKF